MKMTITTTTAAVCTALGGLAATTTIIRTTRKPKIGLTESKHKIIAEERFRENGVAKFRGISIFCRKDSKLLNFFCDFKGWPIDVRRVE